VEDTSEIVLRGLEHPVEVLRIGLKQPEGDVSDDPVCGIPLDQRLAVERRQDRSGEQALFCSESCLETWLGRLDAEGRDELDAVAGD
jgi:YHS domain-containing protein